VIGRAAVVLLLAAEGLAFYTLGEVVMRIFPEPSNELVSAPAFIGVAFVAYFAPSVLEWFAVSRGRAVLAIGLIGLVVLYGALRLQYAHDLALWDFSWLADFILRTGTIQDWIPPVLTSACLLLATWTRAAWRARSGVWLETAPRSLAIPFALVTVALLITAASEQAEIVTRGGVVFYGVALAALACSQLAQSGSTIGNLRAGGVTTLMLIGTAAFAALGVLLVGVLLEPIINFLAPPVEVVGRALLWFLTWAVFFPIAWVLTHFFEFIFGLLGGGQSEPAEIQTPEAPVDGAQQGGAEGDSTAARVARYVLAGGAVFLGVAIVAGVVFVLALLRRRAGQDGRDEMEAERVGGLGEDLRGAARNLFRRDRRRAPSGEGALRLYLEVLDSARRSGVERADSQTPHEFAPVLLSAFKRDVTDEITDAFENARYADRSPSESTLDDLRRRWEQRD